MIRGLTGAMFGSKIGSTKTPYIETDGVASYIDLGFVPTGECTYEVDFRNPNGFSGIQFVMASYSPRNARYRIQGNNDSLLVAYYPSAITDIPCSSKERHVFVFDGTNVIVDGNKLDTKNTGFSGKTTMKLGTSTGSASFGNVRFYSAKFWESGVLIRDLVPYSGPRGVGLLDNVNDVLYTNANTSGTLTYGEE